jgi:UDPglucose 6-dehydrogenase
VIDKLQQVLKILKGKTIGLLGLTFKPDTGDLRDAPALDLIGELNRLGAKVRAYDPVVAQFGSAVIDTGLIVTDPMKLADGCDALLLITEWQEFKMLDYYAIAKQMKSAVMVDGRNFLDREVLTAAGFQYIGIGC